MSVNPKFVQYKKINMEEIEVDQKIADTKEIWGLRSKKYEENERVEVKVDVRPSFTSLAECVKALEEKG